MFKQFSTIMLQLFVVDLIISFLFRVPGISYGTRRISDKEMMTYVLHIGYRLHVIVSVHRALNMSAGAINYMICRLLELWLSCIFHPGAFWYRVFLSCIFSRPDPFMDLLFPVLHFP